MQDLIYYSNECVEKYLATIDSSEVVLSLSKMDKKRRKLNIKIIEQVLGKEVSKMMNDLVISRIKNNDFELNHEVEKT